MSDLPAPEEFRIAQESASYFDVYPARGGAPLVIALHGYGGNKRSMARLVRPAVPEGFALAVLQGPHPHIIRPDDRSKPLGFGFGWVTNWKPEESIALHHAAIDAIVSRLTAEGRIDPSAVFLIGFSQSVALNFRYAFTFPGKVRGVVAVAGGIPGDWSDSPRYRRAEVDVLYVAARDDDFYTPETIEKNARALETRGARVDVEIVDGGHDLSPATIASMGDWLARRARPAAPARES